MSEEQSPVATHLKSYFKVVMGVLVILAPLAFITSFAVYVFGNGTSVVPTSMTMVYLAVSALLIGAVAKIAEVTKSKTQTT
jgi:magnesium-transporting ATPase (P-type)